ncbi:hypothetical protein D9615_010176 [Tricholomella constricta]|uniref:Adenylate kinase n=1 Tax=Tricholomella constricta TaxID=117010 RepID=A0A8H5GRK5_9AGAR|nr:hypothetical protein D9615_010176 [Tricholomella constricta]
MSKSTTGAALAKMLGVPFIALDQLYWEPGWKEASMDEFIAKIRKALNQSDRGWVVDGSYANKGGHIVTEECTDVVWLDPPLVLYFPRLFVRTVLRLFRLREPCSPGCEETWTEAFFSKKSILWWCLTNHWPNRRRNGALMAESFGTDKVKRLGGWGEERRKFLNDVADMCRAK